MKLRVFVIFMLTLVAALAGAGTLTVTAPTDGAFLGATNNVSFNITGAILQVTMNVHIVGPATIDLPSQDFTPDADGKIQGTIAMNFSQSTPEGAYTITITATEPGNSYVPVVRNVTVDVTKPKFFDFNPIANSFVRGPLVPIVVKVLDANFKEYHVQVNSQDIPDNSGTTLNGDNTFTVPWDVTGILQDGGQTIDISVKDQANNEATESFTVTIDRVAPVTNILYPRSDTHVRPRSTVPVSIDIADFSGTSVSFTGLDVRVTDMADNLLFRVPRTSFQDVGGNHSRWNGRIRSNVTLPHRFKLVVSTVDKAGNVGAPQTTVVTVG